MKLHRPASLTITEKPDGSFFLSGYAQGKQIRIKRPALSEVEELKREFEDKDHAVRQVRSMARSMQYTVLTAEQLRDAEAAFRMLEGKRNSLIQCVAAAKNILGDGAPKDALEAMTEWIAAQTRKHLAKRTLKSNEARVKAFMAMTKIKTLDEISPAMVEKFVFIPGIEANSELARVRPIKAWLNFCTAKKFLSVNPCEINVKELADNIERSHEKEEGHIITPAQCDALIKAAMADGNGELVPYTILALYCFLRNAEVQRTVTEKIHLDYKVPCVDVFGKKNGGKFRTVDIPANVVPLLQECAARGLLVAGQRVPFNRPAWDRIREAAGFIKRAEWTEQDQRRKIVESTWQENVLRHTGETYRYAKTGDIKDVARQAGHSQETAFKHYLRPAIEGMAEKFFAMRPRFPAQKEAAA